MITRLPRRHERHIARRRARGDQPLGAPNAKETLLVGWIGMRGILTLAAASAVPAPRRPLGKAVADRELDEDVARAMIEDIDLRQAARNSAT